MRDLRRSVEFVNFSKLIDITLSCEYGKLPVIAVVFLKKNRRNSIFSPCKSFQFYLKNNPGNLVHVNCNKMSCLVNKVVL